MTYVNDPTLDTLPEDIPIFPLEGVLLLPRGDLPLNIFEPRYVAMVDYALATHRLIGMIQPSSLPAANGEPLFATGCVGRITRFEETADGRYIINLRGVSRFRILNELMQSQTGFRRVKVTWQSYARDLEKVGCLDLDRSHLLGLLKRYFEMQGIRMDWDLIDEIADESLMTTLAMVCPFTPSEKQALLEAPCCFSRAGLFVNLLEMAIRQGFDPSNECH